MADIALRPPQSTPVGAITATALIAAIVILTTILIALNWSAVLSRARDCKAEHGAFSSGFSSGFDTDRRACPHPQSDAMPLGMPSRSLFTR